ncbi:MAG: hypothetical protein ACM3SY_14450 [Candidatus Omnitrophota bacterium]
MNAFETILSFVILCAGGRRIKTLSDKGKKDGSIIVYCILSAAFLVYFGLTALKQWTWWDYASGGCALLFVMGFEFFFLFREDHFKKSEAAILGALGLTPLLLTIGYWIFEKKVDPWGQGLIWWVFVFNMFFSGILFLPLHRFKERKFCGVILFVLGLMPVGLNLCFCIFLGEVKVWPFTLIWAGILVVSFLTLYLSLIGMFRWLLHRFDTLKVKYPSESPDAPNSPDKTERLTGLLIIPKKRPDKPMPILSFQHWSQFLRKYAPSQFTSFINDGLIGNTNFIEILIGMLFSQFGGYAIAMADYYGMGEDEFHTQPTVDPDTISQAVIDLLLHVKKEYVEKEKLFNWNGELFLIGYSEGGNVTMATSRRIQERYEDQLTVTACAPMAGFFSFSERARRIMLELKPYKSPHLIPKILRGYNLKYGNNYGNGVFKKKNVFKAAYQHLWELFDGYHSDEEIDRFMPKIPQEIFSDEMLNELAHNAKGEESAVYKALRESDEFNWKPAMPMRLYHCPDDDVVPFENSRIARDEFKRQGSDIPLIPVFSFMTLLPFLTIHARAALPCFYAAAKWFNAIRKANEESEKSNP